jgi:hypothetical protein
LIDPVAGVKRVHVHHGPFLNRTFTALGIINLTAPDEVLSLSDLLLPDLIQQAFSLTDTVTLRKRKLTLSLWFGSLSAWLFLTTNPCPTSSI